MTDLVLAQAAKRDAEQRPGGAPYMSYPGFQNYFARFRTEGLPSRFDGSYFGNASGSLVSQVRSTLHHLDLIDEERRPTELLKIIAEADDAEQKQHLRTIFEEKYSDALALGKNATSGELADVFRNRGLTGATVEKAITFYLGMAQDLGFELSPHFRKGRPPTSNGAARRRRPQKTAERTPPPPPPTQQRTNSQPTTLEEQKAAYVTMLMDLAKREDMSGDAQPALLDRIERALGIGGSPPTPQDGGGGDTTNLP
jgi:hypothetical protein